MGAAGIFRAVLGGEGARRRSREEKFILFPSQKSSGLALHESFIKAYSPNMRP